MRVKTIQIVWHEKKPVYSVDFHSSGVLATGGGDKDVKLWEVKLDSEQNPVVTHLGHLMGHTRAVNTVRFAPSGQLLASAGVGGEMYLWKPSTETQKVFGSEETDPGWKTSAALRGHTDDVQDLAWAPDSSALISGSIENICIIWDVEAGARKCRLEDHRHYVQGVTWDPASEFVISQSADRTCRVYGPKGPVLGKKKAKKSQAASSVNMVLDMQCLHVLSKRAMPASGPSEHEQEDSKPQRLSLFQDEQLNSFFRRLAWSPDGSFLVVPCGQYKQTADSPTLFTAYVYARGHWAQPFLRLPATNKAVVAVRFCPQLFSLRDCPQQDNGLSGNQQQQPFQLPYRMVFAIATLDSIIIYDTQQPTPIAVLGSLHFEAVTDLAWSCDGAFLAISSYDGYCSIASFDKGELGEFVLAADLPPHIRERVACAAKQAAPAASTPHPHKTPGPASGSASMPPPSTSQASRLQQEDFSMLSPLPMRKMNASMAVGEKSGMKRIAPTPIVAGNSRPDSTQNTKKVRRIAPEAV
ncbi:hypothetical protein WJX82_009453 [Trebouxia sp. C0006]